MALSTLVLQSLQKTFEDSKGHEGALSRLLHAESREFDDTTDKGVIILFADIMSLGIKEDGPQISFYPLFSFSDRRSFDISDLSKTDLDYLHSVIEEITFPILKARIAHILWLLRRDFSKAIIAVECYLELFQITFDPEAWSHCFDYMKRAITISCELGNNKACKEKCITEMDQVIKKLGANDPRFLVISLIDVLIEKKSCKDPAGYIQIIDELLEKCKADMDLNRFEAASSTKLGLMKIAGIPNAVSEVKSAIAEFYELLSNKKAGTSHIMQTTALLEKAVLLYRQANKKDDEIRVRHQLEDLKRRIPESMHKFSHCLDLTEPIEKIRKAICKLRFEEKMLQLVRTVHFYSKKDLQDGVLAKKAQSPLASLFPMTRLDKDGKTIIKLPPLDSTDPTKDIAALEMHMHDHARSLQEVVGMFLRGIILGLPEI